jgi:predicted nucleic acid-binding protein
MIMIAAVDSNVLFDILLSDEKFLGKSLYLLETASRNGTMIICEIVYSELASHFNTQEELDRFMVETRIQYMPNSKQSLFYAAQLWMQFKKNQRRKYFCPTCGEMIINHCKKCSSLLNTPHRILNDFILGAHACFFADTLLTRDRGFYKKYFKELLVNTV